MWGGLSCPSLLIPSTVCVRWMLSSWKLCMKRWTPSHSSQKPTVSRLLRSRSWRTEWVRLPSQRIHLVAMRVCSSRVCVYVSCVCVQIREEIDKFGIKVYQLPECDSDEDEEFKQLDKELKVSVCTQHSDLPSASSLQRPRYFFFRSEEHILSFFWIYKWRTNNLTKNEICMNDTRLSL